VRRAFEPVGPTQWRDDAIGVFSGVVNDGGIVPFAGPSPLVVEDPASLPPTGTEVTYVVFTPRNAARRAFYARNVRIAR
jgi:hypothetical protein